MKPVYLAGPINGQSDSACIDWRARATELLRPLPVINPMDRDYRGKETLSGQAKLIVEKDKEDIDGSGALLVWYPGPSVGTAMEIMYAKTPIFTRDFFQPLKLPVYIIDVSGKPLSPWLLYHATEIFSSLETACAAVKEQLA